jgi:hypothetical protein
MTLHTINQAITRLAETERRPLHSTTRAAIVEGPLPGQRCLLVDGETRVTEYGRVRRFLARNLGVDDVYVFDHPAYPPPYTLIPEAATRYYWETDGGNSGWIEAETIEEARRIFSAAHPDVVPHRAGVWGPGDYPTE